MRLAINWRIRTIPPCPLGFRRPMSVVFVIVLGVLSRTQRVCHWGSFSIVQLVKGELSLLTDPSHLPGWQCLSCLWECSLACQPTACMPFPEMFHRHLSWTAQNPGVRKTPTSFSWLLPNTKSGSHDCRDAWRVPFCFQSFMLCALHCTWGDGESHHAWDCACWLWFLSIATVKSSLIVLNDISTHTSADLVLKAGLLAKFSEATGATFNKSQVDLAQHKMWLQLLMMFPRGQFVANSCTLKPAELKALKQSCVFSDSEPNDLKPELAPELTASTSSMTKSVWNWHCKMAWAGGFCSGHGKPLTKKKHSKFVFQCCVESMRLWLLLFNEITNS